MRDLLRRWGAFLGAMLGAFLLVFAFALLLTQTDPGRERILAITLETLGGQLSPGSRLTVEHLEGGMFTGARMYGIELVDPAGRIMVSADSAFIEYQLATFFGGDVVIDDLVLHDAEVLLYRMPGDSLWNYQAVLQDTTPPSETDRRGRATILRGLRLVDSEVTVRLPWAPADDLSEAEREREIEAALSDTSRLAVESVPGGYLRTIFARTPDTVIEALTVAPPERGGTYLRIARSAATVDLYRDAPLRIEGMEGELSLQEGVLRFVAPRVELPDSRLAISGVMDMSGDEPRYDLLIGGDEVALRDVQWLYPAFPDDGRAEFRMQLETRPDELFMRTRDLVLEAPGTRLAGNFTMLMGDSLLFSDVALRADPMDMGTVEEMLPVAIPVRGLEIGAVEVESAPS